MAFVIDVSGRSWNRVLIVLDAVALSLWAAAGAQKTLVAGLGWLAAILLGTLTAVGGGATRDLMLQRIPAVFGGNSLYASVAVLVAADQVLWSWLGEPVTGTAVGVLAGLLFRLVAYRRGWRLPAGLDCRPRWARGKGGDATTPGRATAAGPDQHG